MNINKIDYDLLSITMRQVSYFDSLATWPYIFLNLSAFKHFSENLSNII